MSEELSNVVLCLQTVSLIFRLLFIYIVAVLVINVEQNLFIPVTNIKRPHYRGDDGDNDNDNDLCSSHNDDEDVAATYDDDELYL